MNHFKLKLVISDKTKLTNNTKKLLNCSPFGILFSKSSYHIETIQMVYFAHQLTGFYI